MARNDDLGCLAIVALIVLVIVLSAALIAFNAWWLMILWGALAAAFGFQTISYGTAILISLALSFVGSFFKRSEVLNAMDKK